MAKQAGGFALDASASGDYSAPVAQAADSVLFPVVIERKSSIGLLHSQPDAEMARCYPEWEDAVIALGITLR